MIRALLTDIGKHETCNLGKNPGHAVVTKEGNTDIKDIIKILTTMSDRYGSNQTDWKKFQLFNSTKYGSGSNLLFKDSTTELREVESVNRNYKAFLGDDYVKDREALASCTSPPTTTSPTTTSPTTTTSVSTTVSPITELVLLIALLGATQHFL